MKIKAYVSKNWIILLCLSPSTQRSYRKQLFDDAIARIVRACIKTDMEIEMFRCLAQKVHQLAVEKQKAEVDYGEIPAEFRGN